MVGLPDDVQDSAIAVQLNQPIGETDCAAQPKHPPSLEWACTHTFAVALETTGKARELYIATYFLKARQDLTSRGSSQ